MRRKGERAPPDTTPAVARADEERTCISDSDDDLAVEAGGAGPGARPGPNPDPGPGQGPGARLGAGAAAAAADDGDAAARSAGRAAAERPGAAASRPAPAASGGRSVLEHGREVVRRLAMSVSANVVRAVAGGEASCGRGPQKAGAACEAQADSAGASASGVDLPCVALTGSAPGSGAAGPPANRVGASAPGSGVIGKLFAGITSMSPVAEALGCGGRHGPGAAGAGGGAAHTLPTRWRSGFRESPSPGHSDAPADTRRVSLPNPFEAYAASPRAYGGCIAPNPSTCPASGYGTGAAGGGAGTTPASLVQMTQRMQLNVRQHSSHGRTAKVRVLLYKYTGSFVRI